MELEEEDAGRGYPWRERSSPDNMVVRCPGSPKQMLAFGGDAVRTAGILGEEIQAEIT